MSSQTNFNIPYSFYGETRKAILCRDDEVILAGPADCVGGEVQIDVPGRGPVRVETLHSENAPFLVYTMMGIAQAEKPFIKGTARLYRVTSESGRSFVATEGHRVLTSRGWVFVSDLASDERLLESAPVPLASSWEFSLSEFRPSGQRLTNRVVSYPGHCFGGHHQGDVQPLLMKDSDRWPFLLQDGALLHNRGGLQKGDWGYESTHSYPCQSFDRPSNLDCLSRSACDRGARYSTCQETPLPGGDLFQPGAQSQSMNDHSGQALLQALDFDNRPSWDSASRGCCSFLENSEHVDGLSLAARQLPERFLSQHRHAEYRPSAFGSDVCSLSFDNLLNSYYTAQWSKVSSIKFERRDVFYDLHVPGAEHYLAEGFYHHNTGKTFAWLWKLHTLANKYPGCQLAIVRKVKADLVGSVLHTFKRDFLEQFAPYVRIYGGENPQRYIYPNGSCIWTGGMDKPGGTLSSERDVILEIQAEQLSLMDHEYLTRCVTGRGKKISHTQIIADCNPTHPTHWIISRSREGKLTRFNSSHRDNPTLYNQATGEITPEGERRLRRLQNLTGVRYKRLFLGLWAAPEGAIFEVYDETRHKVKAFEIPRGWSKFAGVDPLGAYVAAVWIAYDPADQVFHVYREYCEPFGIPTSAHVKAMLDVSQGEFIQWWATGGPSERQQRLDFSSHGLPACKPGVSDVWAGIDRIIEALDGGELVIHDSCPKLLDEIGSYSRKMGKDGLPMEKTILNKDTFHLVDSLRYGWTGPDREPSGGYYERM